MTVNFNIIAQVITGDSNLYSNDHTPISTLLIDSRDLTFPSTSLFFALRTSGNDGHRYIPDLIEKGVRHFVVEKGALSGLDSLPDSVAFIETDNVVAALQKLASYGRSLLGDKPVVAITGSAGKTVVKEQINYILKHLGINITRSPRSYNSQIGVPLSLWETTADTQVAVFEAGISKPGEMENLADIIRPQIGVFTSLTQEHSEGFDSMEQKAREKVLLFKDCRTVFIEKSNHSDMIAGLVKELNPSAQIINASEKNEDLSVMVSEYILSLLDDNADCKCRIDSLYKSIPHSISSRICVSETLKNCLVVFDGFTFDDRSLLDSLNFANRHLTPGRSLTLVIPFLPSDSPETMRMLEAKGVSRLITVSKPVETPSDKFSIEYRDYSDPRVSKYTISDFSNEVVLVKGDRASLIEEIRSTLEAPRHETVLEVDLGAITRNFNFFRSHVKPETGIIAMVKAAGYGIGALELAKTLQNQGASYLAVAVIDEGVELRHAGIDLPIIVMNPISTNYNALFDNRIEPSVFSIAELDLLLDNAKRLGVTDYPVHIKLDTGMHRLGFTRNQLPELIDRLKSQNALKVASIFSHLATADCLDQDEYTESQLRNFKEMSEMLMESIPYKVKRHVLNTAGILRYPDHQYDMVRLGIGLYGVAPIPGYKLDTVARLVTTIISIKEWEPGITIGYGRRGIINKPSVIATIPIGYADGMNRHLSNGAAWVLVNGVKCPIVGNICMDQCMIDVTEAGAKIGDTVEIFGPNAPITRLSDTLDTIPYEILTSVSPRVKRIYFKE